MDGRFIEELSLNNWQPLSTLHYDGWVLRFADSYTKRANSISPLHPSVTDLEVKIRHCENIYSELCMRPTFKITPYVRPEHLDSVLEEKGYSVLDVISVRTLSLENRLYLALRGRPGNWMQPGVIE